MTRSRSALPSALALLPAMAIVLSAATARAQSPDETPSTEEIEAAYPPPSARWAVTLGGLAGAAAFYGGAAGLSYAFPDVPGAQDLRIPIVGPWLAVAHNKCAPGDTSCDDSFVAFRSVATALDGVAQVACLAIALEGIFLPTQEAASKAPARPRAPGSPASPTSPAAPKKQQPGEPSKPEESPGHEPKNLFYWSPTPMTVGARGVGVGIVGRF
jgi:hypothetical protein